MEYIEQRIALTIVVTIVFAASFVPIWLDSPFMPNREEKNEIIMKCTYRFGLFVLAIAVIWNIYRGNGM